MTIVNVTMSTYTSKLISLYLGTFLTASESPFINQVWELNLHHLVNDGESSLKTFFGLVGDMKVKWRVLWYVLVDRYLS